MVCLDALLPCDAPWSFMYDTFIWSFPYHASVHTVTEETSGVWQPGGQRGGGILRVTAAAHLTACMNHLAPGVERWSTARQTELSGGTVRAPNRRHFVIRTGPCMSCPLGDRCQNTYLLSSVP